MIWINWTQSGWQVYADVDAKPLTLINVPRLPLPTPAVLVMDERQRGWVELPTATLADLMENT